MSNESGEDVRKNVSNMFERAAVKNSKQNIDRAHRIGKAYLHKKLNKGKRV